MTTVWRNVTLEMSPKPFKLITEADIRATSREVFLQWSAMLRHAEMVSVLLWTADGSEILDYSGDLADTVEWARYLGSAGTTRHKPAVRGARGSSLHGTAVQFHENPPVMTYGTLKMIVDILKEVGTQMTGLPVRVGATFDPGPEFAQSPFKYTRHPELLRPDSTGGGTFICCYATLNADNEVYAGYPQGIPQDTPLGTFLGRQSQHFLSDLGFDYIWFSNGFGFGYETWGSTGALFDGERFNPSKANTVADKIVGFWQDFRRECPEYPIETRGTNLGTGIDLASDGVPLKRIYDGGFNMTPPPNSPWAAIDGDFGLEMAGYMSHMAEVPGDHGFPFRFYLHDPWWINSPWFDRYGREPHDLFLPLSVARVTADGSIDIANRLDFLTIDNSYGEMPVQGSNEVTAHILAARLTPPDQPGPLVWVYPFNEYHALTFGAAPDLPLVYYGDWTMREAINAGFPLNTVVSTEKLLSSLAAKPRMYDGSVLCAPVPAAESPLEASLLAFAEAGGAVLLYGPTYPASQRLLDLLGLAQAQPLEGEFTLQMPTIPDQVRHGSWPATFLHRALFNAGGIAEIDASGAATTGERTRLATVGQDGAQRTVAVLVRPQGWHGGQIGWTRATNSSKYVRGRALLQSDDPAEYQLGGRWLRWVLDAMGLSFRYDKPKAGTRDALVAVHRNDNAFFFSGYMPDTTAELRMRFPQGAPLLLGYETEIEDGFSTYRMPRGWQRECRVFVEQTSGIISCTEVCSVEVDIHRRIWLRGLQDATVRAYLPAGADPVVQRIWHGDEAHDAHPFSTAQDRFGSYVLVEDVSGNLVISW